jgi:AcrR family transcriptional regulator
MTFSPLAEQEQEARPERLVQAARDLANETGNAGFTVAQVTARAGLSLKSFYRCYPGKDDLLLALLAGDTAIGAEVLEVRMAGRTGADGVEAYVTELFAMLSLPGAAGYAGILVREYMRLAEHHGDELRAALAPLHNLLARNLAGDQPNRDAQVMFGVLLGGIHDVVTGKVTDTAELARYLHRFCTQGVGR